MKEKGNKSSLCAKQFLWFLSHQTEQVATLYRTSSVPLRLRSKNLYRKYALSYLAAYPTNSFLSGNN